MPDTVKLGSNYYFDVPLHRPDGSGISNADETPRFWVVEDSIEVPIIAYSGMVQRAGFVGWYKGEFPVTAVLGFETQRNYQVMVSGKVQGCAGLSLQSRFRVETNSFDDLQSNIYHADINFVRDQTVDTDDLYMINFFKNGTWLSSGVVTPCFSVVNKSGSNLISPIPLTAVGQGSFRYSATGGSRQTQGEIYNILASAVIDNNVRQFPWILGKDAN